MLTCLAQPEIGKWLNGALLLLVAYREKTVFLGST